MARLDSDMSRMVPLSTTRPGPSALGHGPRLSAYISLPSLPRPPESRPLHGQLGSLSCFFFVLDVSPRPIGLCNGFVSLRGPRTVCTIFPPRVLAESVTLGRAIVEDYPYRSFCLIWSLSSWTAAPPSHHSASASASALPPSPHPQRPSASRLPGLGSASLPPHGPLRPSRPPSSSPGKLPAPIQHVLCYTEAVASATRPAPPVDLLPPPLPGH